MILNAWWYILKLMDNTCVMVPQDELLVGNHDSLSLFGGDAQQKLQTYSKKISSILINSNDDLDDVIQNMIDEIDSFQKLIMKKTPFSLLISENKKRSVLIKKYNDILFVIDKMEITLKLQEAQLIKEVKVIEEMIKYIDVCAEELEKNLVYGKTILNQKSNIDLSDELEDWYRRLSKKIETLELSQVTATQSYTQLRIMLKNNTQLTDKIIQVISGTIPTWRNQITILLGIEKLNRNVEIQNRVMAIVQKHIDSQTKAANKKIKEHDLKRMMLTNDKLRLRIDELKIMENQDSDIRWNLSSLFN